MKNTIEISKLRELVPELPLLNAEQKKKLDIMSGKDQYGSVSSQDAEIQFLNSVFMAALNPEETDIILEVQDNGQVLVIKGEEKLLGLEYLSAKTIEVFITGNEQQAQALFGQNIVLETPAQIKKDSINWDNVVKSLEVKKEFLINQLNKNNINAEDLKTVAVELWDYEMFEKALNNRPRESLVLVHSGKCYSEYLPKVLNNPDLMAKTWDYFVGSIYRTMKNMQAWKNAGAYAYENHSYSNFINQLVNEKPPYLIETVRDVLKSHQVMVQAEYEKETNNLATVEQTNYIYYNAKRRVEVLKKSMESIEQYIQKLQFTQGVVPAWQGLYFEIKMQMDENLKNKDWLLSNPKILPSLYSLLEKDLKIDKEIVIQSMNNRSDYTHFYVDSDFFESMDNCVAFWGQNSSENRRAVNYSDFVAKLGKKRTFTEFISKISATSSVSLLFEAHKFPDRVRYDEKILSALLDKFPHQDFFSCLKKDIPISIIDKAIKGSHPEYLPLNILYLVEDKNIIRKCIENKPELLNYKGCPISWRHNPEMILTMPLDKFNRIKESYKENDWIAMFGYDIEAYKKLIEKSSETFGSFPTVLRNNPEVFGYYAEKRNYRQLEHLPQSAYCHRPTLYKLLENSADYVRNVPVNLWTDKDFVLMYARLMDQENARSYISNLPRSISNILTINEIESDYEKFFLNCFMEENMPKNKVQRKLKI